MSALDAITERIERHGSIGFDEFMELALYHPEGGFYSSGGGAGRRGDFITSPEVGPLFGAVLARALDTWWQELGCPDPFMVVEAGAGRGTLAVSILAAEPACAPALRYVLVERCEPLRASQGDHLAIEQPSDVFGPWEGDEGGELRPRPGGGPVVTSLTEFPAARFEGVILANELLDNLAFSLVERRRDAWHELRVGLDGSGRLEEIWSDVAEEQSSLFDELVPDAPEGARIPWQQQASVWVRDAPACLERGRLVVIDYASDTPALARRPSGEWLRTYRGHERGDAPLSEPGSQDITVEVAIDQLARIRRPTSVRSQSEFLAAHGIDELVDEGRRLWNERAHLGDLVALKARSRVREAESLTDPDGLGAFQVAEWVL